MLTPLGLSPSFGFGDRLGLATPGHIAAVRGTKFAPIFAQQSVRENARTGRTPQEVMDDARRAVEAANWDLPWGADADHLKTLEDLPPFVDAGYTCYTVDPGEHVDNTADVDPPEMLQQKIAESDWEELSALYLHGEGAQVWPLAGIIDPFEAQSLVRAIVKYGKAIRHAAAMFHHLSKMKEDFDFEVSVDETDSPTTPLEHFFLVNELTRLGVRFTSLAPRFIGRFEKGVDYIGDLEALDAELAGHAAVTAHFGIYKLSLHSGSDKFSVYPLIAKHWGERIHVKTAGTSYLEALRVLAEHEPDLFLKIYSLGRACYETDRLTYHVSAKLEMLPETDDLPSLLNDFHAREVLHVTFGSALAQFGEQIKTSIEKHTDAYIAALETHFTKHLALLK
ncbi:MAG TPA: tagaturonate epimerase family protein [Anaerolineales bacterium]|nr:tagaturonate epimerase family protein [Anaerolineales bacterium]